MAIVAHVTPAGLPDLVHLCDDVVWVPATHFAVTPRTGMRLNLPDSPSVTRSQQRGPRLSEVEPKVSEDPGGRWVVLVTDLRARDKAHPVYFACGRLVQPYHSVTVPPSTQAALARAIETSSDLHGEHVTQTGYCDVERNGKVLGQRLKLGHDVAAMGPLPEGTPVWVRTEHDADGLASVSEIRLSLAWRRTSRIRTLERVPKSLRPCQDPADLCPSCRLFGSAGADDKSDGGPTAQNSYRGHIRFLDAVATKPPVVEQLRRAPLSSPKPTAGQFYLDNAGAEESVHPDVPTAQWDSSGDSPDARKIRGRKFYWRTHQGTGAFPVPQHRGRIFGQRNAAQAQDVTVLGKGSSFTTTVTFDNLSRQEIGSLLAASSPHRVLGEERVLTVGGGRPFGWGAVRGVIAHFVASNALSRYVGAGQDEPLTAEACLAAYQEEITSKPAASQWPTLAKLLKVNLPEVMDAYVWYPPNPKAGEEGITKGTKAYDEGFRFWQGTNGTQFEKRPDTPLKSLPPAHQADQNIPTI